MTVPYAGPDIGMRDRTNCILLMGSYTLFRERDSRYHPSVYMPPPCASYRREASSVSVPHRIPGTIYEMREEKQEIRHA